MFPEKVVEKQTSVAAINRFTNIPFPKYSIIPFKWKSCNLLISGKLIQILCRFLVHSLESPLVSDLVTQQEWYQHLISTAVNSALHQINRNEFKGYLTTKSRFTSSIERVFHRDMMYSQYFLSVRFFSAWTSDRLCLKFYKSSDKT